MKVKKIFADSLEQLERFYELRKKRRKKCCLVNRRGFDSIQRIRCGRIRWGR